jgi:DNA-binding XRE family transcriptional regulator
MKLEDFRTTVALLTQKELANLAEVSESTIYQIEAGRSFSKLTRGKVLAGLSKHLKRQVDKREIDEFKDNGND